MLLKNKFKITMDYSKRSGAHFLVVFLAAFLAGLRAAFLATFLGAAFLATFLAGAAALLATQNG